MSDMEGYCRAQRLLLPDLLDDYVTEENPFVSLMRMRTVLIMSALDSCSKRSSDSKSARSDTTDLCRRSRRAVRPSST
jgi:hypothetical protein